MKRRSRLSSMVRALGLVLGAALLSSMTFHGVAAAAEADGAQSPSGTGPEPGVWQPRKIELVYMGFTSTYSCDGLQSKLELLLRQLGARPDFKVMTYACPRGYGEPSKFVRAEIQFASLRPAAAAAGTAAEPANPGAPGAATAAAPEAPPVDGAWRSVELAPHHPFDLQDGDCELIEQFRDKVLPLFTTRQVQARITCIPYQDTGGPFDLQLQVFAPVPAAKGGASSH